MNYEGVGEHKGVLFPPSPQSKYYDETGPSNARPIEGHDVFISDGHKMMRDAKAYHHHHYVQTAHLLYRGLKPVSARVAVDTKQLNVKDRTAYGGYHGRVDTVREKQNCLRKHARKGVERMDTMQEEDESLWGDTLRSHIQQVNNLAEALNKHPHHVLQKYKDLKTLMLIRGAEDDLINHGEEIQGIQTTTLPPKREEEERRMLFRLSKFPRYRSEGEDEHEAAEQDRSYRDDSY